MFQHIHIQIYKTYTNVSTSLYNTCFLLIFLKEETLSFKQVKNNLFLKFKHYDLAINEIFQSNETCLEEFLSLSTSVKRHEDGRPCDGVSHSRARFCWTAFAESEQHMADPTVLFRTPLQ